MRNEQTEAAENNSYGQNWRESTDFSCSYNEQ